MRTYDPRNDGKRVGKAARAQRILGLEQALRESEAANQKLREERETRA